MTASRPSRVRGPALAWALCGLTVALALAAAILYVADPRSAGPVHVSPAGPSVHDVAKPSGALDGTTLVTEMVVVSVFSVFGGLAAARRPRNPVPWLFVVVALSLTLTTLADALYWHLAFGRPGRTAVTDLLGWYQNWGWIPAVFPLFCLVPLLFPTGAPPGRRWRPVLVAAMAVGVVSLVANAFRPGPLTDAELPWIDNPVGIDGVGLDAISQVVFWMWGAIALAAIASLVVRFRRARGVERLQLRWVAAAAGLLAVSAAAGGVLTRLVSEDAGYAALMVGLFGMAAAVAIALLRHRLYDIDVVVNRALVYGALTLALGAAYLATVLVLQVALSPLTSDSQIAVAASTLAVAALFRPARSRIQHAVDRRFFRSRYDATLTLDGFAGRIRREVELDAVSGDLCTVVAETMRPAHVSLWLRTDRR